jgi:hypothetical protein
MNDPIFVEPTPSQIEAIMRSGAVHDGMDEGADEMLNRARAAAPVDTGAFRDSFAVQRSAGSGEAEAFLVNDDPGAASIEFGTEHMAGFHVMALVADQMKAEA